MILQNFRYCIKDGESSLADAISNAATTFAQALKPQVSVSTAQ